MISYVGASAWDRTGDRMSSLQAMRHHLLAYVDSPKLWRPDRDIATMCRELEEELSGSIQLFRELQDGTTQIQIMDAELQSLDAKSSIINGSQNPPSDRPSWSTIQGLYSAWLETSRSWMTYVRHCNALGQEIEGASELSLAIAEAEAMLDNAELDAEVLPFETLTKMTQPSNPDPSRYRD